MNPEASSIRPNTHTPAEVSSGLDTFRDEVNGVIAVLPEGVRPPEVKQDDQNFGYVGDGRLFYGHVSEGSDGYDDFVFGTADPRDPGNADVRHVRVPQSARPPRVRGQAEKVYFDAYFVQQATMKTPGNPDSNLEWAMGVTNGAFGKVELGEMKYAPFFIGRPKGDDGTRDISFTNELGVMGTATPFAKLNHLRIIPSDMVQKRAEYIAAQAPAGPSGPLNRDDLMKRADQPRSTEAKWDNTPPPPPEKRWGRNLLGLGLVRGNKDKR